MPKVVAAVAAACFTVAGVAGPADPVVQGLQLAMVDFEVVHGRLIDRCRVSAPESVDALVAAIAGWKSTNAEAVRRLRQHSVDSLVQGVGLSPTQAAAQVAGTAAWLTDGLANQFTQVPETELTAACTGRYADQVLSSPLLDFNALLGRLQSGTADGANSR